MSGVKSILKHECICAGIPTLHFNRLGILNVISFNVNSKITAGNYLDHLKFEIKPQMAGFVKESAQE